MSRDERKGQDKRKQSGSSEVNDAIKVGSVLASSDTVSRYGSANAEYLKGYSGIDQETGQQLDRSLKKVSSYKLNPDNYERNVKQQSGFSAEVAATSRDNAEAKISGSKVITSRSEDISGYGKNHTVVDRVQLLDGKVIIGSESQMKFVGNPEKLLKDITKPDGDLARYRDVLLELPSEQVEEAREHCLKEAKKLFDNADGAERAGKPEVAQKLREWARNYEKQEKKIRDAGLTSEEARSYRLHPKLETAKDIGKVSLRSGVEGAKYGALIRLCVSTFQNSLAVAQEKKQVKEAIVGTAKDTAKGGAMGFATAASGAALKGAMQQSSKQTIRAISKTNFPAMAVQVVVSLGASVRKFVKGEISEAELLEEIGEKSAGMLASSMMATFTQIVIPIPFVGAAIGGVIGYSLSSLFYQSALQAAKESAVSEANLAHIQGIQEAARVEILLQQEELEKFIQNELCEISSATKELFLANQHGVGINSFCEAINEYAELLGEQLQFKCQNEFDAFMEDSKAPLKL